jgi:hypothetical protein
MLHWRRFAALTEEVAMDVAVIRYSGDSSALTIRSEWQDLAATIP